MDLELADWMLAVVSFMTGTIVPVVYGRLTYEGVSLRQPFDVRGVFQDEKNRQRSELVFSTVVKIVNAQEKSLIIDDIQGAPIMASGIKFEFVGLDLRTSEPGDALHLPPHTEGVQLDYLPLLIKGNTERLITLGIWFRYTTDGFLSEGRDATPTDVFMGAATEPGLKMSFRINGKYRGYVLHAKAFERWKETSPVA
jgi:hypothetical protein